VYFQADRTSPIFHELQGLLLKTAGLVDVIREALQPMADRIAAAFVFGSAARGELRGSSDVDVLVVGDVSFVEVSDALAGAQVRLGRDVNPSVYPPSEFEEKVRAGHHFLSSVMDEPTLFIMGDTHDLARMGAERVGGAASNKRQRDTRPSRSRRARSRGQRR
jgi:predicted nucleotidyltransferase